MAVSVEQRQRVAASTAPSRPMRYYLGATARYTLLTILALIAFAPFILSFLGTFKTNAELVAFPPSILPKEWLLDNWLRVWNFTLPTVQGRVLPRWLFNSAWLALVNVLLRLFFCSLAAYAFARMHFRGRRILFAAMLLTLMLPFQVTVVPQYIFFSQLHWINTFLPLIVPKFLATDAFFVFLMVQFIRGLPRELDEAARMDGAGHGIIYLRIILPLMVPALATATVFTFIWTWNDFFSQLLYETRLQNYTAAVALNSYLDQQGSSDFGGMFAMSVVCLAPLFFVFLFGQRYLVRGIATTGIR